MKYAVTATGCRHFCVFLPKISFKINQSTWLRCQSVLNVTCVTRDTCLCRLLSFDGETPLEKGQWERRESWENDCLSEWESDSSMPEEWSAHTSVQAGADSLRHRDAHSKSQETPWGHEAKPPHLLPSSDFLDMLPFRLPPPAFAFLTLMPFSDTHAKPQDKTKTTPYKEYYTPAT